MLFDRVSFATATVGTGTITAGLASAGGYRTLATGNGGAPIPDGTSVEYCIEDTGMMETGTGVVGASATTLTRVLSQSSTGALLVLTGAAKCFLTPISSQYNGLLARANHTGTQAIATILAAATARLFGRITAAAGPGEELTAAQVRTLIGVSSGGIADADFINVGNVGVSHWVASGNGSGALTVFGDIGLTVTGTVTAQATGAGTNAYTATKLSEALVTVAATTAVVGFRAGQTRVFLGNAANRGGFKLLWRFAPATGVATATNRLLVGLRVGSPVPTDVEPSSLLNMIGVGWDAADANIQMMRNDGVGVATKIDLGANFPVPTVDRTRVYELRLQAPPNSTTIEYMFYEIESPALAVTGSFSTDLPAVNVMLGPAAQFSVGGTSSVIGMAHGHLSVQAG